MQGYNHVAGGITFTAIFSSFHDVNIFEKPLLTGATVFFALLPDIDHTRSAIGKTFYPVASFLQSRYGHRTITHSLFFLLGWVGLLMLAPNVGPAKAYAIAGSYALLSHLLFDMCTKQGVPLLYPFSKRPFVLPANPGLRLSAHDHRSEAIVFVVFCCLFLFCKPLFAQGFWTTYNRAFATWEHAEREGKRSADLLHVVYKGGEGLFYKKAGSEIIVLTTSGFDRFPHDQKPLIAFEHSGFQLQERQITISGVSLDSLNLLLSNHCARVQIQSTDELTWFVGNLMHTGKVIDLEFQKNLLVNQLPHDDAELRNRIALARIAQADEHRRFERAMLEYRSELQKIGVLEMLLRQLADEFPRSSDYRKGEIIKQREEAERKLDAARLNQPLPPLVPNLTKYELDIQLLEKQLYHQSTINANLIKILWKPRTKNS